MRFFIFILWYILRAISVGIMTENWEFQENLENWAQSIESHQRHIFEESVKFVEALKQRKLSAKTKNDIAITLKGLQATTKSVSKVIGKYIEKAE